MSDNCKLSVATVPASVSDPEEWAEARMFAWTPKTAVQFLGTAYYLPKMRMLWFVWQS